MKRLLFVSIAAVLAVGCGDDDDDGQGTTDAGGIDASVMPDAEPSIDAVPPPTDATPPMEMTITVENGGVPAAGIDVLFSAPDGAVIAHETTDKNGEATATVGGNSMISIFRTLSGGVSPTVYQVHTLADVEPTDEIVFDLQAIFAGDPLAGGGGVVGTVDVTLPGVFDPGGGAADAGVMALEYTASEGCESVGFDLSTSPTATLEVNSGCQIAGGSTVNVIAQAVEEVDMFSTRARAHAFELGVSPGDNVVLEAWSEDFTRVMVTANNFPAGAFAAFGDGTFIKDGVEYDVADDTAAIGATSLQFDALAPDGIEHDAVVTNTANVYVAGMSVSGFSFIAENQAAPASAVTYDMTTDALPGTTNGAFATADAARPVLAWDKLGDLSVADLAQVVFAWDEAKGTEVHLWNGWMNPGEGDSFKLPALPNDLADYAPTAESAYNEVSVQYLDASWVTTPWAMLRETGGVPLTPQPATDFTVKVSFPFVEEAMLKPAPAQRRLVQRARELIGSMKR